MILRIWQDPEIPRFSRSQCLGDESLYVIRSLQDQKIQRLSKIFSAYFQRLFKDLWEQLAVEKLRV